jgi:hypothetical protein
LSHDSEYSSNSQFKTLSINWLFHPAIQHELYQVLRVIKKEWLNELESIDIFKTPSGRFFCLDY